MLDIVLLLLLFSTTLIQLWYWGVRFALLARYQLPSKKEKEAEPLPPVSIVISARNEAHNLRQNLPLFIAQDYPVFEIIVVNDHSEDETEKIILEFQKTCPTLHLLSKPAGIPPGKKAALNLGIQHTSFDTLFFSDADCQPISRQWLRKMQWSFQYPYKIVLGYGPYHKQSGWLNLFIRFEAFYTAIQYFSFALAGKPYMGVGRNLAYHKEIYLQAEGFSRHAHLLSGDDDLLVNQMATADNTTINLFPDTRVYSDPKTSLRGYYYQKRRHLSTGSHYRQSHQFALGALAASHFAFYVLTVALWILHPQWWLFLTLNYLVRIGVVLQTGYSASKHLGEHDLLPFLPLLDFLYLGYYIVFAPSLLTGSRIRRWK
ncbi:MAG: glycosyltransferase [Saprospiraceae bacterium]